MPSNLLASRISLVCVFALALITHVTNVLLLFLIGRELNMSVELQGWFVVVPPALLLAALPITSGGWGLREASFVIALASFGVSPEKAIIPSVIFGLGVLLVTLPGGIVLLLSKRDPQPAAVVGPVVKSESRDRADELCSGPTFRASGY